MNSSKDFFEVLDEFDFDDVALTFLEVKLLKDDLELITKFQLEGDDTFDLWKLGFEDVHDHQLTLGYQLSSPYLETDHVLLWPHIMPHASLFFKGTTTSFDEFINALYQQHLELVQSWIPFGKYLSDRKIVDFVKVGYGLFAEGPEPLIQGYARIMQDYGIKTSILTHPSKLWRNGKWVDATSSLQVFICGNSFVVSGTITTEKLQDVVQ